MILPKEKIEPLFLLLLFSIVFASDALAQTTNLAAERANFERQISPWEIPADADLQNYELKLDKTVYRSAMKSIAIISHHQTPNFAARRGSLMQVFKADSYRGKRMRLAGFLKTENAEQAGFWFRVDGENMQVLGSDTMANKPIIGSTDWKKYELVLDVPAAARQIVFGVFLKGVGQIWADDFSFEEVARDVVPITATVPQEKQAEGSLHFIETYKRKNKDAYEAQLRGFEERNRSARLAPANLDFELF